MSELSISRVERVHRCSGCHDRLDGGAFDAALDCPRCGALALAATIAVAVISRG